MDWFVNIVCRLAEAHWIRPPFLICLQLLPLLIGWMLIKDTWGGIFFTLFVVRYLRLIGHIVSHFNYRPSAIDANPRYLNRDVTVIVPTVEPNGPDFEECIRSILANGPAVLLVVTVGTEMQGECQSVLRGLIDPASETHIAVSALAEPSKRRQVAHAMPHVETSITILADDHVFWPSKNFLASVLAPFEDPNVGVVATKKRVRRTTPGKWNWLSIVNLIACNYLERHNWELRASNSMDGGVFVVSGRTAVYRTDFLKDEELLQRFCNEKFFFGLLGGKNGLGPDDDNFLTREAMKKNLSIRFQDTEDATIETTLGDWPKFRGQLLRWARTTFRSNPVMLRDPRFFCQYAWSWFMVYWVGLLNFALLWDAAMICALALSKNTCVSDFVLLLVWIFSTKLIKLIPHMIRCPSDIPLMICQIVFSYIHSFIKFWALITFWDCGWSGRNLSEMNPENGQIELNSSFQFL